MTENESLAFDILRSLDFAVLRRAGPGDYVFFGTAPAFYDALFPPEGGEPCAAPWEISPMLEFFLVDAEEFFERRAPGSISSGIWTEDGMPQGNAALMAHAIITGGTQAIVIRQLVEEYAERADIVRKAREQLLENRLLANNLTIYREKSRIDGLTRIFNKTTFTELLVDEIKRSQILQYPLSLLLLDIDDFKLVNDRHGHPVGDKILQNTGATLESTLRRNDVVARFGGEEFVVLLPHAALEEAAQVAEKIRSCLGSMIVEAAPRVTVSIGCAELSPNDSPEDFIKRADDALYDAKRGGKNMVSTR